MPAFSVIPDTYDFEWMAEQCSTSVYTVNDLEDGTLEVHYGSHAASAFADLVENYDTAYVSVAAAEKKAVVVAMRKEKVKQFVFNGMPIDLDAVAEARITGAVVYLDRNPTVTEINWDPAGNGNFVTIPRDTMLAMGDAAGDYVQGCFNNSKALVEAIAAATTLTELDAIDIEAGWPSGS